MDILSGLIPKETRKLWCQSPFFNKVAGLAQVFSCEFCEIFKNNFFHRTPLVAAYCYFIPFLFCKNKIFYSKNIQYASSHMQYNFYGAELYVNVRRGVFRTKENICDGASLRKSQKNFIVDVRLGSNYASGL